MKKKLNRAVLWAAIAVAGVSSGVILYHPASQAAEEVSSGPTWDWGLEFKMKSILNNQLETDVAHSHLNFNVGNAEIEKSLRDLNIPKDTASRLLFDARIELSVVPWVIGGSTEEKLLEHLDEKLAEARPKVEALVRPAVTQAVNSNPAAANLSPEMRAGMIQNLVKTNTDAQLAAIRQAKADTISKRISDLQIETSVQQVVLGVGKVVGDSGEALVFLQAGKAKINGGFEKGGVEDFRPIYSAVMRQSGTANTGMIELGYVSKFMIGMQPAKVSTELFFFHDRVPFVSGSHFIGQVAQMTDAEYDHHAGWHKLDSAAFKTIVSTEKVDVYLVIGSYNGDAGGAGGVIYRINDKNQVEFHGYLGERKTMKSGYALYFVHHFNERFSVYAGYERTNENYDPVRGGEKFFNRDEVVAGARVKLMKRWDTHATLEVAHERASSLRERDKTEVRAGVSISLELKRHHMKKSSQPRR